MGLFQRFTDYMWLSECDVWITDYAPEQAAFAREFCKYNKGHLLMLKSLGKTPHEAVIDTCIFMVNAIAEGHGDTMPHLASHLTVAYQTGFGMLNRWPNVKLSKIYSVRMFRTMALVDNNIWQSPLAKQMAYELDLESKGLLTN